jgi:transposase
VDTLVRRGKALWVFLDIPRVEATDNGAERAHRFGVLWRKRSQGTCSEKGNCWLKRCHACSKVRSLMRLRSLSRFPFAFTRAQGDDGSNSDSGLLSGVLADNPCTICFLRSHGPNFVSAP